jgi:phosphoribosylglycinamide formyltransferase-1
MGRALPIAILASGEGTTLEAFAEAVSGGHVPARIQVVISDRPHAPAIERARRRGLPTAVLPFRGTPEDVWSARTDAVLRERGVELVLLAGFLSILPGSFVRAWKGRVINLHPSLLPKYGGRGMYGSRVHEAVLAAGDPETGATVHLVTDDVDRGPVLEQLRVAVEPGDTPETLRERVRPLEQRALIDVVRRFADGVWPLPYRSEPERPPARRHRETSP